MEVYTAKSGKYGIVNCTPHPIRFQETDGTVVDVAPSGYTLPASPTETSYNCIYSRSIKVELVKTSFVQSQAGRDELAEIYRGATGDFEILPIGSIISAQAWPGQVFSLVPVPGYERKPPAEKLYHIDKFNVFE